jgi:hypothetical protein
MPYSKYKWYNIKVVVDNFSKTYAGYINNVLKAIDFSYYSSNFSFPSKFQWGCGDDRGAGWIDDLKINAKNQATIKGELEVKNVILNNPASQSEKVMPEVWGELKFTTAGAKSRFNPNNIEIILEGEGYFKKLLIEHGGYRLSSRFVFYNVPEGKTMRLMIKWDGKLVFNSTYKFTKPNLGGRSLKIAGYLGTFTGEISSQVVNYSSKY